MDELVSQRPAALQLLHEATDRIDEFHPEGVLGRIGLSGVVAVGSDRCVRRDALHGIAARTALNRCTTSSVISPLCFC